MLYFSTMMIRKYDVCKKVIERDARWDRRAVEVTIRSPYDSFEFCPACGEKLIAILKKEFHLLSKNI